MKRTIYAADLFCGAGGASVGLKRACDARGVELDLVAVNHWPVAVKSHMLNHPRVKHYCEAVERVNPRVAVPGGRLDLLMAGPSCVHFSRARGGKPVSEQLRASPKDLLKWLDALDVSVMLVENVPEFRTWGPVNAKTGKPIKARSGQFFREWVRDLEARGYRVEWQVLNSADFGDPTTRKRFWLIARKRRGAIAWPEPTHAKAAGQSTLFSTKLPWVPASSVIDWTIPGKSIYNRERPLSLKTLWRILVGLERFCTPVFRPFLVIFRRNLSSMSVEGPLPALTAGGTHVGLAQPYFIPVTHGGGLGRVYPGDGPLPALTGANRGELAVIDPFIVANNENNVPRSLDEPLSVVTSGNRHYVTESFIVPHRTFQNMNVDRLDQPVRTITSTNARQMALCQGVLVPGFGERAGQAPRAHSIAEPAPTITGRPPSFAMSMLVKYNGTGGAKPLSEPVDTITAVDRYGLVQPIIDGYKLEILFRMLQPHELAAATGFPAGYVFTGTKGDQVRQIGNAWTCGIAQALTGAIIDRRDPPKRAVRVVEATA